MNGAERKHFTGPASRALPPSGSASGAGPGLPPAALPPAMAAILGKLPPLPGSLLFAAALNIALRPYLPDDVRASLLGRRLRLTVSDAALSFDYEWRGERFAGLPRGPAADLEIAASARDLLALARREEDPDTLFFSRRLSMSGDTELGLLVKNTLDAIDTPLPEAARHAVLAWLRNLGRFGKSGLR
ncbi:SCP2 domain-containing protein [Massilia sp. Root351]|jgi:predicted lipid carrier protein YhbT|uniref:ubiquinone anaerobic biosynthesis accessory factor UbiT n=1 Tax=Massilia sp. Root351 TaxID=1736522 RepID=UPI0009EBEE6F|nr:SCP2 sterol-binding domain-containing protein [Massilia sp. Root351]